MTKWCDVVAVMPWPPHDALRLWITWCKEIMNHMSWFLSRYFLCYNATRKGVTLLGITLTFLMLRHPPPSDVLNSYWLYNECCTYCSWVLLCLLWHANNTNVYIFLFETYMIRSFFSYSIIVNQYYDNTGYRFASLYIGIARIDL